MPTLSKLYVMLATVTRADPSPVMAGAFRRLEEQGVSVVRGFLDAEAGPLPDATAYLFKSLAPGWLPHAQALTRRGARLIEPMEARLMVRDKAACTARLARAGIPVPRTFLATDEAAAALARGRATVLKPRVGGAGEGVQFLAAGQGVPAGAASVDWIVQEQVDPLHPTDLKLSLLGNEVFATRKRFAPGSARLTGDRVEPTPAQADLARAVGAAVGARLLGLDVVETVAGPVVVDVNWFPSYRAFEEAPQRLADFILSVA